MDDERYYLEPLAAFVRGKRPDAPALDDEGLLAWARAEGLRVHRFKRSAELPRVKRVIGILRSLAPADLLDVGSGRGVFLWPLLDAFPHLPVTSLEVDERRASDLVAVREGDYARLGVVCADVREATLDDGAADVVTVLEVLEHLPDPIRAARNALRMARRAVVVSVPSKPDDNPEHIQLFSKASLEALLLEAGAARVSVEFVLNHMIAVARPGA